MPEAFKKLLVDFLNNQPDAAADTAAWVDRKSDTSKGAEEVCNDILMCIQGDN